jgi:uracil-DNA glycosylase
MDTEVSTFITQVKKRLIESLQPSGWGKALRMYLNSSDFTELLELLYEDSRNGRNFTPELKYVFRAFTECPYDQTNVVILGQDPYPHMGVADGIAFSCSRTGKAQPSLQYIFGAVKHTVYPHVPSVLTHEMDTDLSRWSKQGVLLLNSALTCQIGKVGSHYDRWKDFIIYLIDVMNFTKPGTIFVLLGKKAQEYQSLIMPQHTVLSASHPASAAYMKQQLWDCNDIFSQINQQLQKQSKSAIEW